MDFLNTVSERTTSPGLSKGLWSFYLPSDAGGQRCSDHPHPLQYTAQQNWERNVTIRISCFNPLMFPGYVFSPLYNMKADLSLMAEILSGCWGCKQLMKPVLLQRYYPDGSQTPRKGSLSFPNVISPSSSKTA